MREKKCLSFQLLINDVDVDTGKYEYFARAEKMIRSPVETIEYLRELKKVKGKVVNPDYVGAKYCVAGGEEIKRACDSAYEASQKFKLFSVSKRCRIVKDIRQRLIEKKEELIDLFVLEAHPVKLARWEYSGMLAGLGDDTVQYFKSKMREEIGTLEDNERVYLARKPDGVVCLIPPRNAPCSNSCTAVLSLLPGNSLIVKPPLRNPVSTLFFWREIVFPVLKAHGAPKGTLNIIVGNSKKILDAWLSDKRVNDIIFFGDSDRGERIGRDIFFAGKKPILELSGNDILVVWKDAHIEKAVESVCDSFLGSSQICMVPKVVFVHPEICEEFKDLLLKKMPSIVAGLPSDDRVSLTPINRIKEFFDVIEDAKQKGAEVLGGGNRIDWTNRIADDGIFVQPTLIRINHGAHDVFDFQCVKAEGFFPVLPIVNIDVGEAGNNDNLIAKTMIDLVNQSDYGLRFSIWIQSDTYLRKFVKYVDNAGIVRVNSKHTGFSKYLGTHGGTKKSGGPFGEMNYFWQKTSHLQGISRTKLIER